MIKATTEFFNRAALVGIDARNRTVEEVVEMYKKSRENFPYVDQHDMLFQQCAESLGFKF